jgi:hypothetical protein
MVPAHHNYQVRLKHFFDEKGITAEWERDFVDIRFDVDGCSYIGEIKVTTTLRLEEAFRTALGQLLEYDFLRCNNTSRMVMFFDNRLDSRRTELATKLGVSVIFEGKTGYEFLNPESNPGLLMVFSKAAAPVGR